MLDSIPFRLICIDAFTRYNPHSPASFLFSKSSHSHQSTGQVSTGRTWSDSAC